jgi:hypothetical protein
MGNIAILSTDDRTNQAILQACADFGDEFVPVYLRDKGLIVQYLNYELPEIIVVNCSDKYISSRRSWEIKGDPWLYSGGFVLLHEEESEQELLKSFAGINLLSIISLDKLADYFPRLLRILTQNRGILAQRDLHFLLQANLSGSFLLENDPFDLITYSNLLANFLFNANLVDMDGKVRFYVALMELLINAIEHGTADQLREKSAGWIRRTSGPDPEEQTWTSPAARST